MKLKYFLSAILMFPVLLSASCGVGSGGTADKTETGSYVPEKDGIESENDTYVPDEDGTENENTEKDETLSDNKKYFFVIAGNIYFKAELAENTSASAFYEKLKSGNITVDMSDYGSFEKVGNLGFSLPRNDENITTVPGDIILYQGSSITIYYDRNTWNFTRIGKIHNVSKNDLLSVLGDGKVTVTFSISEP